MSIAHPQHAHPLAVFLAEQRHRAKIDRLLHAHVVHFGFGVAADFGIHHRLDSRQLLGADRLEMRKVEAHTIGRIERPGLFYVCAENVAQRGVD